MKTARILAAALVLLTSSVGAAAAQDSVLAQGDPPLTTSSFNRLVDLYEFALAGRFSPEQRGEFRRRLVAQWAAHDTKAVEAYQTLLGIYEKLSALDDARLREAQAQFRNALLAELERNPNAGCNPLLRAVYNGAHGGEVKSTGRDSDAPASARPPRDGGVPGELVGKWQAGSSSSTGYADSATGATQGGGGTQVMYTFFPDGRFEYASLYTLRTYNCATNTMLYKTGRVELDGSTLTLVTEGGKFTSEDTCNRQYNYEKPAKLGRETYAWRVERDEYGTKICLKNSGVDGCAYGRD